MKNIFFILIILLIESKNIYPQSGWQEIYKTKLEFPTAISFADENYGTITGYFYICRTNNGGKTWASSSIGPFNYKSVKFYGADTGYLIALNLLPGLYKTTNKGIDWYRVYSTSQIADYCFVNAVTGYYVEASGNIFKTTNGGMNWIYLTNNYNIIPTGMNFADADNGIIVDNDGRGLSTTNGGLSWNKIFLATGYGGKIIYPEINSAYVISNNQQVNANIIRKTTDYGSNWSSVYFNKYTLSDIFFHNADTGTVIGLKGIILKTNDGGLNWISQAGNSNNYFVSICFINSLTGWIVDSNGLVFKTTTGGDVF